MIHDFIRGGSYFWRGFSLLARPRIRTFVALPILINVILFGSLTWLAGLYFDDLVTWMVERLPSWLTWLEWLLWIVFAALALVVVTFTFVLTANLVSSPFNGMLAEAVEELRTGRAAPSDPWTKMLRELPRTLWQETAKIVWAIAWAVPFLLLFLVPVVNAAAPFIWIAFSAWVLAVEYADYPMDNNGVRFREIRTRLAQRRGLALGFGFMTFFAFTVPILNLLAMPSAVIGATLMWVDDLKDVRG